MHHHTRTARLPLWRTGSPTSPSPAQRGWALPAGVAILAVVLTGCGSNSAADDSSTSEAAASSAAPGEGGPGGMPGASGKIAAIDGSTLQVQNDRVGQVAVTIGTATVITAQVDATLDSVEVGTCVVVQTDDGSEADAATLVATSVSIDPTGDSGCGLGARGGDLPTDLPTDLPSDLPSDRPGGSAFGTVGEVTSIDDDGFTVTAAAAPSGDAETGGTDGSASSIVVTVTGSTTYTTQATATTAALKVGRCVTATGEADDTGTVEATALSVSDAVDGTCAGGFGLGGPAMDGPGVSEPAPESGS